MTRVKQALVAAHLHVTLQNVQKLTESGVFGGEAVAEGLQTSGGESKGLSVPINAQYAHMRVVRWM